MAEPITITLPPKVSEKLTWLQNKISDERVVNVRQADVISEALGALWWKRQNVSPRLFEMLEDMQREFKRERDYHVPIDSVMEEALEALKYMREHPRFKSTPG